MVTLSFIEHSCLTFVILSPFFLFLLSNSRIGYVEMPYSLVQSLCKCNETRKFNLLASERQATQYADANIVTECRGFHKSWTSGAAFCKPFVDLVQRRFGVDL